MKTEIRNARIDDAEAICCICSDDLGYPCSRALVESKLKHLSQAREAVFVALADGKNIAGYIHIETYDTLYFETMGNILGLAVKSDYRRKGIGKALLMEAEDWAMRHNIHHIRLNSGISRKEAHAFYQKLGYDGEKEQLRFIKKI